MDPATLVSLLAGGAIAKMNGLGGDMASDAYEGLKKLLTDGYHFQIGKLEAQPKDEDVRKSAEKEISASATTDPGVIELAQKLEDALAKIQSDQWENKAGVLVRGLTANRDIRMGTVRGRVTIEDVKGGQDIVIGDMSG